MDNLTHTAVGLFLSRAGLNQYSKNATPILLLAANAPDVDVASAFGGAITYLQYHRHLSHSLAMMPVMALLPLLIVRLATRQPLHWLPAYLISLAGVASHLALDSTNIYGVGLLLPFSTEWFHLDTTSVVDLWIWGVLLACLLGPVIAGLVGSEIGTRPRRPGRRAARLALGFLLLYTGARAVLHTRAVAILEARLYAGAAPLRVAALPVPVNPWRWRGLVETREFYSVQEVDLLGEFDPAAGQIYYKPEAQPALEAARRTRAFQVFLDFSQYPLWRVTPVAEPENGTAVEAMDMRFGSPARPGFVATAILDGRMQVIRSWFTFGAAPPR